MSLSFRQQGMVLVTSLILLVVMMLLAISSVNMSTVNLRIVNNMQAQQEAEGALDQAVEAALNSSATFDSFVPPADVTVGDYTVAFDNPMLCTWEGAAEGWSRVQSYNPFGTSVSGRMDTDWTITSRISATTANTGANAVVVHGVRSLNRLTGCPTT